MAKSCLTPKWTPAGETATGSAGQGCSPPCWCGCRAGGCCRRCCSRGPRWCWRRRSRCRGGSGAPCRRRPAPLCSPPSPRPSAPPSCPPRGAAPSAAASRTCCGRRLECKSQAVSVAGRDYYHWRELPQVSFLSRQKFCCRDKIMFVATKPLLRQTRVCRDKHKFKHHFVATKLCLSRQYFS